MHVTVNGMSLNSSGVSGTASNEYAAMTAAGAALGTRSGDRLFFLSEDGLAPLMGPAVEIA